MKKFMFVTNEEYMIFCKKTKHEKPAYWIRGKIPVNHESFPVTIVSALDADAYCAWKGCRLPTGKKASQNDASRPPWLWEWTSETNGAYRGLRGGSWYYLAGFLRAGARDWYYPAYRNVNVGFRCASHQ